MRYKNRDSPARQVKEDRLSARQVGYRCINNVEMSRTCRTVFTAGILYSAWHQEGTLGTDFLVAYDDDRVRHILLDPETDEEGDWLALHFKKEDSDGQ